MVAVVADDLGWAGGLLAGVRGTRKAARVLVRLYGR